MNVDTQCYYRKIIIGPENFFQYMLIILILNINANGNFHLLFHPTNKIYLSSFFLNLLQYNNLKSSDLNYLETVKSFDSLFLDFMSVSISINDTPSLNSLCIKTIKPASLLTLIIFIFGVSTLRHKKKKINSRLFPQNWFAAYGLIKWKAEKRITWKIHWVFKL